MRNGIIHRIADIAQRIEPDRRAVWEWLLRTPIGEFDGRTAIELAHAGEGQRVVELLEAVLSGARAA